MEPGTPVEFLDGEVEKLRFPPPSEGNGFIAVHENALKAPQNTLTFVLVVYDGQIAWLGAVDERMLQATGEPKTNPRALLKRYIDQKSPDWPVVSPGLLTVPEAARPRYTVYDGERPWVILGKTPAGTAIAAPLNDAKGNPKWWAPRVSPPSLKIPGAKASQVELAHIWTLDPTGPHLGSLIATRELKGAATSYLS